MITAASTSPDITSRGYELIFRTSGLDSLQGPTAGTFIADTVKPKNVAVIHDEQQYGEGIATAVKQTLEDKGVTDGLFEGVNAGDTAFSSPTTSNRKTSPSFTTSSSRAKASPRTSRSPWKPWASRSGCSRASMPATRTSPR